MPPQSPQFQLLAPSKIVRKKLVLLIAIFVSVLTATMVTVLLYRTKHNEAASVPASKQILTLYYRDGKTVLWSSADATTVANSPAFVEYVKDQLKTMYGPDYQVRGEWHVTTTLDKALQATAKEQVLKQKNELRQNSVYEAAFIAEDVTNGQVVSWLGSFDDAPGVDQVRQKVSVGTLELPLTYAAYMEHTSKGANAVLDDSKGPLQGWPCTTSPTPYGDCLYNFDMRYLGNITLAQALTGKRRVPAAKAALEIGIPQTLETTTKMGADGKCYTDEALTDEAQCYTSSSFGESLFATPQHMLQAYATIANGGGKLPQVAILQASLNGKTNYTWKQAQPEQAIHKDVANALTAILSDVNATIVPSVSRELFTTTNGTKTALMNGLDQTGTATGVVQFTPKYAAGFWAIGKKSVAIKGPAEVATIPVTYAWLSAVQ